MHLLALVQAGDCFAPQCSLPKGYAWAGCPGVCLVLNLLWALDGGVNYPNTASTVDAPACEPGYGPGPIGEALPPSVLLCRVVVIRACAVRRRTWRVRRSWGCSRGCSTATPCAPSPR